MSSWTPAPEPWLLGRPLEREAFAELRLSMIFECRKWDLQVSDHPILVPFPIVLQERVWKDLAFWAEALSAETFAAEEELLERGDLYPALGLPRSVRKVLEDRGRGLPTPAASRVIRFDFHWTTEGWKISEANTDVPSGFNEASGLTRLMSAHYPEYRMAGDPAEALAEAAQRSLGAGAFVVFLHATAYSEDRQVMEYLARCWEARGFRTCLASPEHLRWQEGEAYLLLDGSTVPVNGLYRFFPAELLPRLPRFAGWTNFYRGGKTPVTNPATALLTQSKRFPLVWGRMDTALEYWRALLSDTFDPRTVSGAEDEMVFKPALGRMGEGIALAGVTLRDDYQRILRRVQRQPEQWAAQRRFEPRALSWEDRKLYPCFGVYTVNGRAAGVYGRLAARKLVDHLSREVTVLIEPDSSANQGLGKPLSPAKGLFPAGSAKDVQE